MQPPKTIYTFIGRVLPDGHLSLPTELAIEHGQAFKVTVSPLDETYETVFRYLNGTIEKTITFEDIFLPAEKIQKSVESAFGTTNIDDILGNIHLR